MAGIFTGIVLVTLATGLGLGAIFDAYPLVRDVMRILGFVYILYFAWRIGTSGSLSSGELARPMSFATSLSIQPANIKLWMTAVAIVALYVRPGHALADSVVVTLAFALTNLPCMFVWAGFGAALREYLTVPSHIRAFNIAMAVALVVSILPLLKG
jgi:threonine/homoserine/homoserine lactone efflux protein